MRTRLIWLVLAIACAEDESRIPLDNQSDAAARIPDIGPPKDASERLDAETPAADAASGSGGVGGVGGVGEGPFGVIRAGRSGSIADAGAGGHQTGAQPTGDRDSSSADDAGEPRGACAAGEVPPAPMTRIECEGAELVLPAVERCTPSDRYVLSVMAANATRFQSLTPIQAIALVEACVGTFEE